MSANQGVLVVAADMSIKGVRGLKNCRRLEVFGYVEGEVAAEAVLVHEGGKLFGSVRSDSAEIHGTVQGDVAVRNLIDIRSSGDVSGNVKYGRLALEMGGSLTAEMRNIPPSLGGDFELAVGKGKSVAITLQDLNALDPDDVAQNLVFRVSNARNGFVALFGAPARPVATFTQADLEAGRVLFTHDGGGARDASFDVVVSDHTGASSGAPQTVTVGVTG